jgi:hypothetical protein
MRKIPEMVHKLLMAEWQERIAEWMGKPSTFEQIGRPAVRGLKELLRESLALEKLKPKK